MSALIFSYTTKGAVIATDTLATTPAGDPVFFTSKSYFLPHLRAVIVGTGYGDFIARWVHAINTTMLVSDVEDLAAFSPDLLRQRWAEFKQVELSATGTSTIYTFGVSSETGEVVAYANRSTSDFASERLPSSATACKPNPGTPMPAPEEFNVECVPTLMESMRTEEGKEPDLRKRVHIGGEIVVFYLSPEGFASQIIHRFPDAEDQYRAASDRLAP